jgi:hypothetical protein
MSDDQQPLTGRIGLDRSQAALCEQFLGWQCRVRQVAVRQDQGRPSKGMRPLVRLPQGDTLGPITVLIVYREPEGMTAQFRHLVQKTHAPADRFAGALRMLQASYYQYPEEFSDLMTALFARKSPSCRRLTDAARCTLLFDEAPYRFSIPAGVCDLDEHHAAFQATYWHNSLFNAAMPGAVQVVGFLPDWQGAEVQRIGT